MTDRRTPANRRNAARSTGPRFGRGKSVSRLNALTHGLNRALSPDVVRRDMAGFVAEWMTELGLDEASTLDLAALVWLLRRIRDLRLRCLDVLDPPDIPARLSSDPALPPSPPDETPLSALRRLARLDVYERKTRARLRRRLYALGLTP